MTFPQDEITCEAMNQTLSFCADAVRSTSTPGRISLRTHCVLTICPGFGLTAFAVRGMPRTLAASPVRRTRRTLDRNRDSDRRRHANADTHPITQSVDHRIVVHAATVSRHPDAADPIEHQHTQHPDGLRPT